MRRDPKVGRMFRVHRRRVEQRLRVASRIDRMEQRSLAMRRGSDLQLP